MNRIVNLIKPDNKQTATIATIMHMTILIVAKVPIISFYMYTVVYLYIILIQYYTYICLLFVYTTQLIYIIKKRCYGFSNYAKIA